MSKKTKMHVQRIQIKGKRIQKSFSRLSDALKWKETMKEESKLIKQGLIKSIGGVDFSDLSHQFLSTRVGTKEGTRDTYESVINTHLLPRFRNVKVKDFRKSHGTILIGEMEELKKASATINKVLIVFKSMMKFAVENEYLDSSPISSVKPLKIDSRNYAYWDKDQAALFLERIQGHTLFNVLKFALNTGLRRGELCGLQWKNIKTDRNGNSLLMFNEQLLPGRRRELVKGHSTRTVPLTEAAKRILDSLERGKPDHYIFKMESGLSIEPSYLTTEFRKLQKEVGIEKPIKLHALRHSFASLLVAEGINIQKVQHLMGHKDSKITERYSHISQDDLMDTVQIVAFD